MTEIATVNSVLDIPFDGLARLDMPHIVSDIESTLAPYGIAEVDPLIADHIKKYQDLGFIASFSLFTNKTNEDFVAEVASQLGNVPYFMPADRSEKKPNPFLLQKAMDAAGANERNTAVIGDKLSADIEAAKRANVAAAFWVKRLGRSDHLGDRLLRRPYEAIQRPFYSYKTRNR